MANSVFSGGEPFWANACVGNNGRPTYFEYAKGYSASANAMIKLVLKSGLEDNFNAFRPDDLVYPVCFNMRHSIELRLKGGIELITEIYGIKREKINFDLVGSHDILKIWCFFKDKSELLDDRFSSINMEVHRIILDIGSIDPTGQTFRYPISNEKKRHLTDINTINFVHLFNSFQILEKNLDLLDSLMKYLHDEYLQGTFTQKLSRLNIFSIAKELPQISQWKACDFNLIKENLKIKYNISSNELSSAINLIKSNYELSSIIENDIPLCYVTNDKLIDILDAWFQINKESLKDPDENGVIESVSIGAGCDLEDRNHFMDVLKRGANKRSDLLLFINDNKSLLTVEMVSDISALYYFSDYHFSEQYKWLYSYYYDEFKTLSKDDLHDKMMHVLRKGSFLDTILRTLCFLGKRELAVNLIDKFISEVKLNSLIEIKELAPLYIKANLWGYKKI